MLEGAGERPRSGESNSKEKTRMELSPVPNVAFASTACFSCYRAPPTVPSLKRCGGCKRIKFCSEECTKIEWKDHKPFCRAFSALRSRSHALLPPLYVPSPAEISSNPTAVEDQISSRRETQRSQWLLEDELLTAALGREQTLLEGKLLYREPRCGVCWDREADVEGREGEAKWRVCDVCRIECWCGGDHESLAREEHSVIKGPDGRTQCQTLLLSSEIDEFYLRHSLLSTESPSPPQLWIPSRLLAHPTPLPPSWEAYLLSSSPFLPSPTPSTAEIYGVFLEALSEVFTILSHLPVPVEKFSKAGLRIHILDASPTYTGLHLPVYEEILHYIPSLNSLSLSLISPSTPQSLTTAPSSQPTCPACKALHRTRSATWIRSSYPLPPPTIENPDLIISFQPSISSDPESWKESIATILGTGVKAVFTAKTEEEARDDLEVVKEVVGKHGRERAWGPERNSWAGGRPMVDGWEEEGVWRASGWVWGIDPVL